MMAKLTSAQKAIRYVLRRYPKAFCSDFNDSGEWRLRLHPSFIEPIVSNGFGDADTAWIDAAEMLGWKGRLTA
jgi:hypothetical protein